MREQEKKVMEAVLSVLPPVEFVDSVDGLPVWSAEQLSKHLNIPLEQLDDALLGGGLFRAPTGEPQRLSKPFSLLDGRTRMPCRGRTGRKA